jgi:hypothetical protein
MKDIRRKGFSDGIKEGGGGFLNNVDGKITGYEFTTCPPNSKDESEWVYLVPSILIDGASDEVTQHFFLGAAENYEISKDGQTLSADGGVSVGGKTPAVRLIKSMLANGLDESLLPDLGAGDDLELSALVDRRYRFFQEIDEEANKKLGKRKVKDPKTKKTVEYNRTNTLVSKVYDADDEKPAKGGKSVAGKASKKNADVDLTEEADSIVTDLLADNDGEIERGKLSLALTKVLMKNANREALKKLIISDDYLTSDDRESIFTLEGKGSKQKIVAA